MTKPIKPETSFDSFSELDIRVGTVLQVEEFPEARQSAYKITIDFGDLGTRQSSAQITNLYTLDDLVNTQIIAVVNFPSKQIATFQSEILILGIYGKEGVVLLRPDKPVANGDSIG